MSSKEDKDHLTIAVEGCCHGELDKIYETVQHIQEKEDKEIDLLLCCGDFQAVRNQTDLESMAVPSKYKSIGGFQKYYTGQKLAPVLTIFIGGNHEASNHLWELPFGGWVAPNIYYMGFAGVLNFAGFKICGLSGIYKERDFYKGHFEKPPFNDSTKRSFYHVRNFEVFKLKLLSQPIDLFMSHDWPRGVYHHGDLDRLLRLKPYFKDEIENNSLGSPPAEELLHHLRPAYWFSAHLHAKFAGIVNHEKVDTERGQRLGFPSTKFLALDKCLPQRDFLQVLDLGPVKGPKELSYDQEWLAINRTTDTMFNTTSRTTWLPTDICNYKPSKDDIDKICEQFEGSLKVPSNFSLTKSKKLVVLNPQTTTFCKKLGVKNPCSLDSSEKQKPGNISSSTEDDNESDASSSSDDFRDFKTSVGNPDEISIEEDNSDESSDEEDGDHGTSYLSSSSLTESSGVDTAQTDSGSSLKRKVPIDSPETGQVKPKLPLLIRRNKAIYSSFDEAESSGSDYV